jgi:hypothetical protein
MSRQEATKICGDCRQEKPITDFGRNKAIKSGFHTYCRVCARRRTVEWRAAHAGRVVDPAAFSTTKRCSKCQCERDRKTAFAPDKRSPDGRVTICRECSKAARRAVYEATGGSKDKARNRRWRAKNLERVRALGRAGNVRWRSANPEAVKAHAAKDRKKHRAKLTAKQNEREALKIRATVAWADKAAINALYVQAREMTEILGFPCHVDHIVPLRSPHVCGLHVETNLRILAGSMNIKKKNQFDPDQAFIPA